MAVLLPTLVKLAAPITTVLTSALTGKPTKLALMSERAVTPTLNEAILFIEFVSFSAPVVPVPATPDEVCKKLIEALMMALGLTLASVGVPNVTKPLPGA